MEINGILRIKFDSKQDRVKGFYELATKGIARALQGGVFETPGHHKEILDNAGVSYRILSEDDEPLGNVEVLRNTLSPYV